MKYFLFVVLLFGISSKLKASHAMGGELTYKCVGGNTYVFELAFYRDCNGAEVNIVSENLRVWNHSSVTAITLPFVSRQDVSPLCNALPGFAAHYNVDPEVRAEMELGQLNVFCTGVYRLS